jgi:hypothetical protein
LSNIKKIPRGIIFVVGDNEGMLGNNVKKTLRDDKGKENDKGCRKDIWATLKKCQGMIGKKKKKTKKKPWIIM